MKNTTQEFLRRRMRQHHRHHQWRLNNGLFIPYAYTEPRRLSWWTDVGFILNGRRVLVWWIHPRTKYHDRIEEVARMELGPYPEESKKWRLPGEKNWKKVGRSRKKVYAYSMRPMPDALKDFHAKLDVLKERLEVEGIDFEVQPSMVVRSLYWCTCILLCAPLEVHSKQDAIALAGLARRLHKHEVTLEETFPNYRYGRKEWLTEAVWW